MTGSELRTKRTAGGIPGDLLAKRARMARSKLTAIEREYVRLSDDEFDRIRGVLEELISARQAVLETAKAVGWPVSAL